MTDNPDGTPVPDEPTQDPQQTVDALEERVHGRRQEQRRPEAEEEDPAPGQDIDPAETDSEQMHQAGEPPS